MTQCDPPSPNPLPPTEGVTQGWQVPDGWKLVPIEPTEEMIGKGGGLCDFCYTKGVHETKEDYDREVIGIYHNMLLAAPLPPSPGQNA